jgi:DNA-binding NarL/FixJ family response regulator
MHRTPLGSDSLPSRANGSVVKRVLIVDDHPFMRRGLAELLAAQPGLEICGEAGDTHAALECIESGDPDLAIIDISLGHGSGGLELIKRIKAQAPRVRMLVSSVHDEKLYAERAIRAGALGYVNKSEPPETMLEALHTVLEGKVYVSQEMTDHVMRRIMEHDGKSPASIVDALSDRELEVFEMVGHGISTREIAEQLHLSVKTIDAHRQNIKAKLVLRNSNELVRCAVQWTMEQAC